MANRAVLATRVQSVEVDDFLVSDVNPMPVTGGKAAIDPFGRQKVANPETVFDSKQPYVSPVLFFDDVESSGAGTFSTHIPDRAATELGVSLTTAGKRIRQSKQRPNYQPGKGQEYYITAVMRKVGGGQGVTIECGAFDDENGLFLRLVDGLAFVVRRTNVTGTPADNPVAQASWSSDPMDGTGPSGVTLDFTKFQIVVIGYSWLGGGLPFLGFKVGQSIILSHEFESANVLDAVWCSNPNLPVRWTIENAGAGGASTMEAICCSVQSEGGQQNHGLVLYDSTDGTHVDAALENTLYAILGLRLKSAHIGTTVELIEASVGEFAGNKSVEWKLIFNASIAGSPVYAGVTNSALESFKGATANVVTNGTVIGGGHLFSGAKGGTGGKPLLNTLHLGSTIAGVVDTVVLCAQPIAGSTAADLEGGLSWRELG